MRRDPTSILGGGSYSVTTGLPPHAPGYSSFCFARTPQMSSNMHELPTAIAFSKELQTSKRKAGRATPNEKKKSGETPTGGRTPDLPI